MKKSPPNDNVNVGYYIPNNTDSFGFCNRNLKGIISLKAYKKEE